MKCLAYFVDKLKNTQDGDGTLLDHSLILYGTNMGDSNQHLHYDVPHILVGGAVGPAQGRTPPAFPTKTVTTGNLLLSILDMYGIHQDRIGDSTGRLRVWCNWIDCDRRTRRNTKMRVRYLIAVCASGADSCAAASARRIASRQPGGRRGHEGRQGGGSQSLISAEGRRERCRKPTEPPRIQWAAYRNDLDMADLLIAAGANVKTANRDGATPLSWLASTAARPMIDKLLQAGADPNERDPQQETPLMFAARNGNLDAIKVLLDHKADVNAQGEAARHHAL